jgi:cobalt-zinc-cadmium efflux system outer membrane protein
MRLGSWWFNRKAAKAGYEAARQGLRSAEQALVREVKSTFYSLLSLERNLQLAEDTIRLNDELAAVARARFERGEVSEVEANIFGVERDSSIQEKKRLEGTFLGEKLRFNNLLGFPPEIEIKPQGELFDHELSFDLDELLSFTAEHRPDLLAAQNRIKQSKTEATLAKVEALPPVTVGFRRAEEQRGESFTGIKVGIGVPVFDQNRARIQETRALREQAEAQFEATKLQVFREVRTAYNNLKLLKERVDIYDQKMKPKLEKNLEAYNEAYQNGQASFFEILVNQRQYFQAKGNYLTTLNEYDQAAAELERVIGGKLEETGKQGGKR